MGLPGFWEHSYTPVRFRPPEWRLEPEERLYFCGSCFADNLQELYRESLLNAAGHPFGAVYNPLSLLETFRFLRSERAIEPQDLFTHQGLARHFLFHSSLAEPDGREAAAKMNRRLQEARRELDRADTVIITLGTAWYFRDREAGRIVNNCHRLPKERFDRLLSSGDELRGTLQALCRELRLDRPRRLILTLSPVRHLRDAAEENSRSKALLLTAIHDTIEAMATPEIWYFPAYEIMQDELRDYRWYGSDRVHPSPEAVSYILERFFQAAAGPRLREYRHRVEKYRRMAAHRSSGRGTPEEKAFIAKREAARQGLAADYPGLEALRQPTEPPSS